MAITQNFYKQIALQAFKYQVSPMLGIIHTKEEK